MDLVKFNPYIFLEKYKNFNFSNIILGKKMIQEARNDLKNAIEEINCKHNGIDYLPIPCLLLRTNCIGIEYGNHWEYFKNEYWKDTQKFEKYIIYFGKYFFSEDFEEKDTPNLPEEKKDEIIKVRKLL